MAKVVARLSSKYGVDRRINHNSSLFNHYSLELVLNYVVVQPGFVGDVGSEALGADQLLQALGGHGLGTLERQTQSAIPDQ